MSCSRRWPGCSGTRRCAGAARAYLLGLLSHAERKNGWTLAELAGDVSPDGMQRLLNFSPGTRTPCGTRCAGYVVAQPGRPGGGAGG